MIEDGISRGGRRFFGPADQLRAAVRETVREADPARAAFIGENE